MIHDQIRLKTRVVAGLAVALFVTSCGKPPPSQLATRSTNSWLLVNRPTNNAIPLQTQTSGNPESPLSGAEVWNVSGTNYSIEGTALLALGKGQTMFVVKAISEFYPNQSHKSVARALAKYAFDHGYVSRVTQSWWNGVPQQFSGSVGVALIQKYPDASSNSSSGYRYQFSVADLEESKTGAETNTSTSSTAPRR